MVGCSNKLVGIVVMHGNLMESGDFQHKKQFVLEIHIPVQGILFRGNHFARGAAIAIILLVMVAVLIVPYLVWSTRTEAEL